MTGSRDYAPLLDIARFVAALAVVAFHWLYMAPLFAAPDWARDASAYGYLGVEWFFMLSGFVIAASLSGATRFTFLRARVARLAPAFLICMALTVCVLDATGEKVGLPRILANLTLRPEVFGQSYVDDVYWTLYVESMFYLSIAAFMGSENRLRIAGAIWCALSLAQPLFPPWLATLLNLSWAPYFSVGIYAFLAMKRGRAVDWVPVAIALILAAWKATTEVNMALPGMTPNMLTVASVVALLGCLLPLLAAVRAPRLRWSSAWLGALSYPLYLLHFRFAGAIMRVNPAIGLAALVAACCAMVVIERPARRAIRRIGPGSRLEPAPAETLP